VSDLLLRSGSTPFSGDKANDDQGYADEDAATGEGVSSRGGFALLHGLRDGVHVQPAHVGIGGPRAGPDLCRHKCDKEAHNEAIDGSGATAGSLLCRLTAAGMSGGDG
jgi:hypothetical protein